MEEVANIEGQEIVAVRKMTEEELEAQGWADEPDHYEDACKVIVTEAGNKIFASSDSEGNSCGVLFGEFDGLDYYI